jgi:hypothetical protein
MTLLCEFTGRQGSIRRRIKQDGQDEQEEEEMMK